MTQYKIRHPPPANGFACKGRMEPSHQVMSWAPILKIEGPDKEGPTDFALISRRALRGQLFLVGPNWGGLNAGSSSPSSELLTLDCSSPVDSDSTGP